MFALILAGCVWAAHFAYYLWPDLTDRAWAQYVGTHAALAVTALALVPRAAAVRLAPIAVGACYLIAIESAQCAVCGRLQWGNIITRDLCVQAFGAEPYALAAALMLATLLAVHLRRPGHG